MNDGNAEMQAYIHFFLGWVGFGFRTGHGVRNTHGQEVKDVCTERSTFRFGVPGAA